MSIIITRHDFTPPPTDPEQAPINAPISIKNDIDSGQSLFEEIEKPVVVSVDTDWKATSFILGAFLSPDNILINNANINTVDNTIKKNLNSGS